MSNNNLTEEIKWLPFKDSSHRDVLLRLLDKLQMDTADNLFVPLYLVASTGMYCERYVDASGIDFAGLIEACASAEPDSKALVLLAEALYDPDAKIDIRQLMAVLEETPGFPVALQAMRMTWEF